jgi:hypothetical protein
VFTLLVIARVNPALHAELHASRVALTCVHCWTGVQLCTRAVTQQLEGVLCLNVFAGSVYHRERIFLQLHVPSLVHVA